MYWLRCIPVLLETADGLRDTKVAFLTDNMIGRVVISGSETAVPVAGGRGLFTTSGWSELSPSRVLLTVRRDNTLPGVSRVTVTEPVARAASFCVA